MVVATRSGTGTTKPAGSVPCAPKCTSGARPGVVPPARGVYPAAVGQDGRIEIVSVNVARPSVLVRWPTKDVLSAIDKCPVAGDALWLGEVNLDGDEQADTRP